MILENEANRLFQKIIKEYSDNKGFDYVKNCGDNFNSPYLYKKLNYGSEFIGDLYIEFFNKRLLLTGAFSKRFEVVEEIWLKFYKELNPVGSSFNSASLVTIASNSALMRGYNFNPSDKIKWLRINDRYEEEASEEGVRLLASKFIENIDKYVLPTFDKFNSIEAIDKVMNATPETYWECIHLFTGNGLIFKKMIVAKLADNPNYDAICESMKQKIMDIEESQDLSRDKYMLVWNELKTELELI